VEAALWENLMMGDIGRFFWKDQNRRFLGASRSFLEYYGFASQQEILGKTDEDLGWHVNPGPFRKDEERVIEQGESVHGAVGDCIVRGRQHTILAYKNPLYCDGKIIGLLGRFVDTEEVIESMEHRSQWVTVDPISGLSNSTGIAATFRNYIESLWQEGKYFAVMQVRVPEYASFCQRYGEEAGNALLARLGQILSEIAGWHYVAGRISGSQFVLFIQQEPEEAVRALADKIRNNIQTVHRLDGWQFACTVHITASFLNTENAGPDQYSRILDAIMAALGKAIEL
jgi:diguanylate cyclase (GGDEF)-like protein